MIIEVSNHDRDGPDPAIIALNGFEDVTDDNLDKIVENRGYDLNVVDITVQS